MNFLGSSNWVFKSQSFKGSNMQYDFNYFKCLRHCLENEHRFF